MQLLQLFFLCCSYLACLLYRSMSLFFFICFFSLLLSWYAFLGVGQRGVVVYHGLVWVRAAVVRPAERAAETPALCAPSRRSVSNHGNHFMYQDQSASIQQGPKMIRQNHAMLKNYTCPPSLHLKLEVKLLHICTFCSLLDSVCFNIFAATKQECLYSDTKHCKHIHVELQIFLRLKIPHMVQLGQEAVFSWPCFFLPHLT